jgi:hypothetical protein
MQLNETNSNAISVVDKGRCSLRLDEDTFVQAILRAGSAARYKRKRTMSQVFPGLKRDASESR